MKYLAITLLFVISLTNSKIILKFKEEDYKFKTMKINIENDPLKFTIYSAVPNESTELHESTDSNENSESTGTEFDFSRKILEGRLQQQICLYKEAEDANGTSKTYMMDLVDVSAQCDEEAGYMKVSHNVLTNIKFCCIKQFTYIYLATEVKIKGKIYL
jgi:hypothetical protein